MAEAGNDTGLHIAPKTGSVAATGPTQIKAPRDRRAFQKGFQLS